MKRNSFFILAGIVGLVEVGIFWLSVELHDQFFFMAAFFAGVFLLYAAKSRITDPREDERSALINEKAATRTLEVFWVIFFAISLGTAVIGRGAPGLPPMSHPPPRAGEDLIPLGNFGIIQMAFLFLMIFLYVGFRMYYARKYGEWDTDEEQD